jgi:ketosteroid isomerase-like protein
MHPFLRNAVVAALAACFAFLAACSQQPAPAPDTRAADEAAIKAASDEWAKVLLAKDLEKTLSYYADEASMFPPSMPIVTGPDGRRKAWAAFFALPDLVLSAKGTKFEAAKSGDIAYEIGTFQQSFTDKGQPVKAAGKYVVVWKKQANGQWKAVADIFNTDQ